MAVLWGREFSFWICESMLAQAPVLRPRSSTAPHEATRHRGTIEPHRKPSLHKRRVDCLKIFPERFRCLKKVLHMSCCAGVQAQVPDCEDLQDEGRTMECVGRSSVEAHQVIELDSFEGWRKETGHTLYEALLISSRRRLPASSCEGCALAPSLEGFA